MDKRIANACLEVEAANLQQQSYAELCALIDTPVSKWARGLDGKDYQIELNAFWDQGRERGDLRVVISIDDGGGWSVVMPLTKTFIMRRDGSLVG